MGCLVLLFAPLELVRRCLVAAAPLELLLPPLVL
jgi:hypothetical protein